MYVKNLLSKVKSAPTGSVQLDQEVAAAFPSASFGVTCSIDAVVRLIETELPGWPWYCGLCKLSNDGTVVSPRGETFDEDIRGGTVPLALLAAFLKAKSRTPDRGEVETCHKRKDQIPDPTTKAKQPSASEDLKQLLTKVNSSECGSRELDLEFAALLNVESQDATISIDAAVRLIESELPGWWWSCGFDAPLDGSGVGACRATTGPDFRAGPASQSLLNHPTMGRTFDVGLRVDRHDDAVPLALLAAFLKGKIALEEIR